MFLFNNITGFCKILQKDFKFKKCSSIHLCNVNRYFWMFVPRTHTDKWTKNIRLGPCSYCKVIYVYCEHKEQIHKRKPENSGTPFKTVTNTELQLSIKSFKYISFDSKTLKRFFVFKRRRKLVYERINLSLLGSGKEPNEPSALK